MMSPRYTPEKIQQISGVASVLQFLVKDAADYGTLEHYRRARIQ